MIQNYSQSEGTLWLQDMPEQLQRWTILFYLERSLIELKPADTAFELLEHSMNSRNEFPINDLKFYLTQLLLRGQIRKAAVIMQKSPAVPLDELRGWLAVLEGNDDQAIACFENGLAQIKKETGKRKVFFRDLSGVFYLLALIRSGFPQHLQTAAELSEWAVNQRNYPQQFTIRMLWQYAEVKQGKNRAKHERFATWPIRSWREPRHPRGFRQRI